jgi:glycosyltransferase involved in cell wall biosynthesis
MKSLYFSFIIPVYNRPEEVKELLESFTKLESNLVYEIVIVEDGSNNSSKTVIDTFSNELNISYYYKKNSGPGDSRNYGMRRAKGNYLIILDSDCLLPKDYLIIVNEHLSKNFVDCFGGPDSAHESFTNIQKAINFAMTSFITTGGLRGGKHNTNKFQPRSFNMGISKAAFEASGGFGIIHPGEDPDLSIRLQKLGFRTELINDAYVFHKRRISWSKFLKQVYKFGMTRPILNSWYPETSRITYWFPTLFSLGFLASILFYILGIYWFITLFGLYFLVAFFAAFIESKNFFVASLSIFAILVQFFGYGYGFLSSSFAIKVLGKNPEHYFPNLFFKHVK